MFCCAFWITSDVVVDQQTDYTDLYFFIKSQVVTDCSLKVVKFISTTFKSQSKITSVILFTVVEFSKFPHFHLQ